MKKYIVFIVVFALGAFLFTGCAKKEKKQINDLDIIKKRGYILIGVRDDSYPFGYRDKDNKRAGIDIEISKEIAKSIFNTQSEYGKLEFVNVTAQDRISKLNSKKVDILAATMSVNDKRKLVLDFSTPYFTTSQKIMVRKDSKITNLSYFNKKGRLCVVLGTTGEKIMRLSAPNANVVGVKTYKEAFKQLKLGAVDAILGDDCILKGLINLSNKKTDGEYKIINRAYSNEFYAVAVRKDLNSKDLLNAVNSAIVDIVDKKKLNVIKSHYGLK